MTVLRGVRGATSVSKDCPKEIIAETKTLLKKMISENDINTEDIASVLFTTSVGVISEFPAKAAREIGWLNVPLLCGHEMAVEKGLNKCIRVLLHWNTDKAQAEIKHIYLNDAVILRTDLNQPLPI